MTFKRTYDLRECATERIIPSAEVVETLKNHFPYIGKFKDIERAEDADIFVAEGLVILVYPVGVGRIVGEHKLFAEKSLEKITKKTGVRFY